MPRYKVWPVPNASDTDDETYFAVLGPDVECFARMDEIAKTMQRALNTTDLALTAAEKNAVRSAIGFVLAGEFDGTTRELKALKSAHAKLSA